VTKDVPPYAVVGGVPAKIIKHRFPEADIEKLLSLKLYDLDEKQILKMREQMQTDDVNQLILYLKNHFDSSNLDLTNSNIEKSGLA